MRIGVYEGYKFGIGHSIFLSKYVYRKETAWHSCNKVQRSKVTSRFWQAKFDATLMAKWRQSKQICWVKQVFGLESSRSAAEDTMSTTG